VIAADLDPIFQGTYSSRAELKQWTRDIERLLVTAEKLDVVSDWLSRPTDHAMLWRAWEPTLFNQTHDLASGVMTDVVYEDTTRSYAFSERLAREMIATAWDNISARIDTYGDGIPVVVYNSLGWARSDIAETEIGVASSGVKGFALLDADGKLAPVQILDSDRYGDGGIKRARIAFVARDVPALGHAVYRVIPSATAAAPEEAVAAPDENSMENETLRLAVDRATGEITSLFDKSGQWETLSGPANVVSRQLDKGDLWELYRGLDGGSHIAMTNQQAVPKPGQAIFSGEFKDKEGVIRRGPVFSEFSVSHPFASGSYSTRVRLYRGLRRVDVQTGLVNNEKWVRYQALFPTTIKNGSNVQEIPFGSVERPLGIEFPAQNWVDYGDGKRGVALLNRGMPGNLVSDGVLMLSLARSHNLGQYGYGGGYEPGMSSETGFELGKRLTFNYALVPHAADWRSAQVYRDGMEFNHPLIAQKAAVHPGKLPARWGLVEISATNVVLTSLNPGAGGTAVLRIYEAEGRAVAGVRVKLAARIRSAWEANLMEDSGRRLRVRGNTVEFDLHPFEIKTVKLALAPTP
jgi:alpha-mannosidase